MPQPLVIAYHLIWTVYGWWLPNDPRGSGSSTVYSNIIAELGELRHGRKRVQPAGRDLEMFYERAADVLMHPLLKFGPTEMALVGEALVEVIAQRRYTCWACAVMPDHVHLLIRKHRDLAEDMIEHLKAGARERLIDEGSFPPDHPVWTGGGGWKVFLDGPDEVRRTIPYIQQNPLALGLPPQVYPWVKPYDGWPLHPRHSPMSPYAKALRLAGRYPC